MNFIHIAAGQEMVFKVSRDINCKSVYNTSFLILIKAVEKYLQDFYLEYQNFGDLYIFSVLLEIS